MFHHCCCSLLGTFSIIKFPNFQKKKNKRHNFMACITDARTGESTEKPAYNAIKLC